MNQSHYQFHVAPGEAGRIDKYLSDKLTKISRSKIKMIIESGLVSLNSLVINKAGTKISPGDAIEIIIQQENYDGLVPEEIPLDILYESDAVIVLNKPAGRVVHPGAGQVNGTLVNGLLAYFPAIRHVGEPDRPGVVHRLDKETSGVLIFAKTERAYRWFVKQFKSRDIEKAYLALVDGHPPTPTGRIEAPIARDRRLRTRMAVALQGQGKPATSEYFELERFQKYTLLEVHPISGRTHQIRVHLSYIGVPVVGDTLYGHRHPSIAMDRFFLHAESLSIKLPGDRAERRFEAPLPEDLSAVLEQLRENERFQG